MMGSENHKIIGSVAKAAEILNLLYAKDIQLGATEIARELNISPGAAHHLLYTLKQYNLVEQDVTTKKYFLGVRLAMMGDRVKDINYLIDFCRPYLKELMMRTGETANLSVLRNGQVIYVAQEANNKLIRMFTELGAAVDAHCSGAGKVLLAGLKDEEIEEIIDKRGLTPYTRNTIIHKEKLLDSIKSIREAGYAIDDEESEEGVMCVAAPVRDYRGVFIAAVSISGPAQRFRENLIGYREIVTEVCAKISQALCSRVDSN